MEVAPVQDQRQPEQHGGWRSFVELDPRPVDKFALAGAVTTGTDHAGFVMPTMQPPEHQYSYFLQELVRIFSGT